MSTLRASRLGGTSDACPSGGKGGCHRAGRRFVAETGPDVCLQSGLVGLGEEEIIALLLDDLGADVTLAEDGIAKDDASLDRQNAEQFEGGFVLVGLGIDPYLDKDSFDERGVGGDEVLAGHHAVAAAAQGLAIQGEGFFLLGVVRCARDRRSRLDPAREGGLEGGGVEAGEQLGQTGGSRGLAAGEAQSVGQRDAVVAAELGDGDGSLATAQHGEDDEGENSWQRMASAVAAPRVGHFGENLDQGKSHEGVSVSAGRGCPLYSISLHLPTSISE